MDSFPSQITGEHLLAGKRGAAGQRTFAAQHAANGSALAPLFRDATDDEIDRCLAEADDAFDALQCASVDQIATLLRRIADGIEEAGETLLQRAHEETALPPGRLVSERGRTVNQTRMFAKLVEEGSWTLARIDHADPHRQPLPKPDVRTMLVGIGPVVVFGASNFPLAISVAGTDTISAFAARCPVVVKAHPGHPGTCEILGQIIARAVNDARLPPGCFSLVQGIGHEVGIELVRHPLTAAVAFTGSLRGGRALFDAATSRPNPIPFYGELGSANPVFLLPGAAEQRSEAIAEAYIQSVTLGVGQFCTNPGIVLAVGGSGFDRFVGAAAKAVGSAPCAAMLHEGIHAAYNAGVARLVATPGVQTVAVATQGAAARHAACSIFRAPVGLVEDRPEVLEEVFGPASLVLECRSTDEMLEFAKGLEGQLTATLHGTEDDLLRHAPLVRVLQRKAGRLVFNGFPTGIEVCAAMHHGGPYPAATHSGYTSIGHASIYRFVRPVCFQNFPDPALPPELQEANPRRIARYVDERIELQPTGPGSAN